MADALLKDTRNDVVISSSTTTINYTCNVSATRYLINTFSYALHDKIMRKNVETY